jgi:hypothetical protein
MHHPPMGGIIRREPYTVGAKQIRLYSHTTTEFASPCRQQNHGEDTSCRGHPPMGGLTCWESYTVGVKRTVRKCHQSQAGFFRSLHPPIGIESTCEEVNNPPTPDQNGLCQKPVRLAPSGAIPVVRVTVVERPATEKRSPTRRSRLEIAFRTLYLFVLRVVDPRQMDN